jgi:uncharacterized protein (UPF0216 family)
MIYILPAGTEIFSIALQENIKFSRDQYIKITNTIIGDDHVDKANDNIQLAEASIDQQRFKVPLSTEFISKIDSWDDGGCSTGLNEE